jgi:hydroxymethylpyrimidine/phosphomethylpyrimidine kinase
MKIEDDYKHYDKALTIAGSDSGGGAGIQADLKTFHEFKCYGASVVTAVTSQNTLGVYDIHEIPKKIIISQLDCVLGDIGFDAIKIGMLFSKDIIDIVTDKLLSYSCKNIVLDPVIFSKNNFKLIEDDALEKLKINLFPISDILTPNLPEAEIILGKKINSLNEMKYAAIELLSMGPKSVIIKGGHFHDSSVSPDCLAMRENSKVKILWLESNKIETKNSHGTGCTFSSAITAHLAKGFSVEESFRFAKKYISNSLLKGSLYKIGNGMGPVCHFQD